MFEDTETGSENVSLDADQILAAIDRGEDPAGLTNGQGSPTQETTPSAEASQTAEQAAESFFREFKTNGKVVKVDDPAKWDQWAQQGYDYAQRIAELKAEREAFERERAELQSNVSRYSEVDRFARENPEWWDHVEQSYAQRDQQGIDPSLQKIIQPLQSEISELKKFYNDVQRARQEEEAARADAALNEEIATVKKAYSDVDFSVVDRSGQSLEDAVIAHANANGIPSFKAAFLDYYHDNLTKLYETRGRQAVEQDLAQRQKTGLLGQTQAPVTSKAQPTSTRGRSYDDLMREAMDELGIA